MLWRTKGALNVDIPVAEFLNIKELKMLGVTSTHNVKSNQGRNFKLSSWNNIERKIYILELWMWGSIVKYYLNHYFRSLGIWIMNTEHVPYS